LAAPERQSMNEEQETGRGRKGARPGGRLSILVLDDDPARHAAFAMEGRGHRIDHAWFVDDAIARLQGKRYDLVCLDNDLLTEACRREGYEVAAFIAGMPEESRPRAVLVHSWNAVRALEMGLLLRPFYQPGVTLRRAEFGAFRLVGPGSACAGEADLRRWVTRRGAVEESALTQLLREGAGSAEPLGGA
jgi:CheY-like chemotaxis protein